MRSINCRGKILTFDQPKIMGIVNITPDSFYEGSRNQSISHVLATVDKMLQEGVDILDLGGFSTRPGAKQISNQEEIHRIAPYVKSIIQHFPEAVISVDTFRLDVAKAATDEGAVIINDVSFASDLDLVKFCVENQIPNILMHMRGTPVDMMSNTQYENIAVDVFKEIQSKLNMLRGEGLNDVIIDPGFGFSKTVEQNYELMSELAILKELNQPLLVGISRKSMIYKLLETTPENALNGTTILNTFALLKGADVLRVHDVKEAVEVRMLVSKIV